jgi:hypothetical protein
MNYLTNLPELISKYGLQKTLLVRREVIHIKHIFTEIFIRKSIDIEFYLNKLDMTLFEYIEYMTQRIRKIHHFSREYEYSNSNKIVKLERNKFFPNIELMRGLKNCLMLDFDGVITDKKFKYLYDLCIERIETNICTANPTIKLQWFIEKDFSIPNKIYANKGKIKKIKQLLFQNQRYDNIFYIDNEIEYLKYAWLFGINTFHWNKKEIKYFTLKTK